jgi:biopolymer transport protein ExbB
MAAQNAPKAKSGGLSPVLVLPILLVVSILIFKFVFGAGSNFEGGDNANHPLPGNYLGMIYKGGPIVPLLLTAFLTTITFVIERFFTINAAQGTGDVTNFVRKIQYHLEKNDISSALADCDKQKGSVANVIRAGLTKYAQMQKETGVDKEQKVLAIQKEIEEATALELPMLEKNLVILSTLASVATLIGLLGTVVGMIRAFAALATAGAPDAVGLANGISEALINTALGISTSAIAIILYNYFTTRIDGLTYGIDEAGFSIAQTFAEKHN